MCFLKIYKRPVHFTSAVCSNKVSSVAYETLQNSIFHCALRNTSTSKFFMNSLKIWVWFEGVERKVGA